MELFLAAVTLGILTYIQMEVLHVKNRNRDNKK